MFKRYLATWMLLQHSIKVLANLVSRIHNGWRLGTVHGCYELQLWKQLQLRGTYDEWALAITSSSLGLAQGLSKWRACASIYKHLLTPASRSRSRQKKYRHKLKARLRDPILFLIEIGLLNVEASCAFSRKTRFKINYYLKKQNFQAKFGNDLRLEQLKKLSLLSSCGMFINLRKILFYGGLKIFENVGVL